MANDGDINYFSHFLVEWYNGQSIPEPPQQKLEHAESDLATLHGEGIVSESEVDACKSNMEKSIDPTVDLILTLVGHNNLPAMNHELMKPRLKKFPNEVHRGWAMLLSLPVANRSGKMFAFLLSLMNLPRKTYLEDIWSMFLITLDYVGCNYKQDRVTYLPNEIANKEEPELRWFVVHFFEFVELTCGDQAYRFWTKVFDYPDFDPTQDETVLEVLLDLGFEMSVLDTLELKLARLYDKDECYADPGSASTLSVFMKRAGNLIPKYLLPYIEYQVDGVIEVLEASEEERQDAGIDLFIDDDDEERYTRLLRSIKKCMKERSQPTLKSLSAIRVWTTIDHAKLIQDLPMVQQAGKPRRERERQCVESLDIPKCLKEYLMDSLREHQIVN